MKKIILLIFILVSFNLNSTISRVAGFAKNKILAVILQPNAFSFTNQTGVALSSAIASNNVTLGGGFTSLTATCGAGCTGISINSGAFVAGPVSGVNSGNTIAIRQTSSGSYGTQATTSVTIGTTTSSTWSVTTGWPTANYYCTTPSNYCWSTSYGLTYSNTNPNGNLACTVTAWRVYKDSNYYCTPAQVASILVWSANTCWGMDLVYMGSGAPGGVVTLGCLQVP